MNSPTTFNSMKAPPTGAMHRLDTTKPPTVAAVATQHNFGTLPQLPLVVQAAFRRKLVTIIALQLAVVAGVVALLEFTCPQWLVSSIIDNKVIYGLAALLVVILLALHFVRDRFPFNWVLLSVLTADLAIALAALDAKLNEHIILANCVVACVFAIVMVLTAGWTRDAKNCCTRVTCGWTPPTAVLLDDATNDRKLMSPFLTGLLAFVVACVVCGVVAGCGVDVKTTFLGVVISFFVQLLVSVWLLYQIHSISHKKTPDAYMSGVIYLYADILIVLVVVGIMFVCFQGNGNGQTLFYGYMGDANHNTNTNANDDEDQTMQV